MLIDYIIAHQSLVIKPRGYRSMSSLISCSSTCFALFKNCIFKTSETSKSIKDSFIWLFLKALSISYPPENFQLVQRREED